MKHQSKTPYLVLSITCGKVLKKVVVERVIIFLIDCNMEHYIDHLRELLLADADQLACGVEVVVAGKQCREEIFAQWSVDAKLFT